MNKIKTKENFSFCRFGDGEWNAILNVEGENCDGHAYFEDMGEALRHSFSAPKKYFMGIQPMSVRIMLADIAVYTHTHPQRFFNADTLHNASAYGLISPFFSALKEREVILVGPEYLGVIQKFDLSHHVVIPEKNCWLHKTETLNELRDLLKDKSDIVVLFSASMAANVYVDLMVEEFDDQHSFFDVGSLLDPYVGKNTRSYHKKLKL